MKHTPAPWKADNGAVRAKNGHQIAECALSTNWMNPTKKEIANAQLIAAAPDMLAALENLMALNSQQAGSTMAIEAIAKAKGK